MGKKMLSFLLFFSGLLWERKFKSIRGKPRKGRKEGFSSSSPGPILNFLWGKIWFLKRQTFWFQICRNPSSRSETAGEKCSQIMKQMNIPRFSCFAFFSALLQPISNNSTSKDSSWKHAFLTLRFSKSAKSRHLETTSEREGAFIIRKDSVWWVRRSSISSGGNWLSKSSNYFDFWLKKIVESVHPNVRKSGTKESIISSVSAESVRERTENAPRSSIDSCVVHFYTCSV